MRASFVTGTKRLFLLALLPALGLTTPALASSHREAPAIAADPQADNTDLYFFRDPQDPSRLVLISNWVPLEEPAGGPQFAHFGENIRYEINVDSNGDALEDVVYRAEFTRHVRTPDSLFQNTGPVTSPTDPAQSVYYTYTLTKCLGPSPNQTSCTVLGSELLEAPNNVGTKSFPNGYGKGSNIISTVYDVDDDTKVFAGPRADGFYIDLGVIFDLINFRPGTEVGNVGGGVNTLAGFNVHSLAISVPTGKLTANGSAPTDATDPNAIVGAWSSTWRLQTTSLSSSGAPPAGSGEWVQVSRIGNPLVNEVVIPMGSKDVFNASYPIADAQFASFVLDPKLPPVLKALFGISVPPTPRNDLLLFVQGIAGVNQRPDEVISDQLRLNTAIPATPIFAVNRLGVLAGDNAGFPNGRRPYDDVVDIGLRVAAGVLVPGFDIAPNNQLGDGVDGPDVPFIAGFPYLYTPHSGFDRKHDDAPTVTTFGIRPSTQ
ncbi:MAG: DUF4331 domain-containing protein [Acidobacteriota bacterium]